MKKIICLPGLLFCSLFFLQTAKAQLSVTSPDKTLNVSVFVDQEGNACYSIARDGTEVLKKSALGLITTSEDFSTKLKLDPNASIALVKDAYSTVNAKKSSIDYIANKGVFTFRNSKGSSMEVIFQVSNDGVAFRYYFPGTKGDIINVQKEITSYHFPGDAKGFLQPKAIAQTGWEHTNPSYEEAYLQDIKVGTPSPTGVGWVYPALFRANENWLLITETGMTGDYAATHLESDSGSSEYHISFPDKREVYTNEGLLPRGMLPWYTPWRIITIGSLKTIVESTLGTDLAIPAAQHDWSFVKPGKATWSWINSKDDFIVYDEQKRYIDFAAQMKWQYCLIDVDWDRKIGYERIKELVNYAAAKNVGVLLWYNSAGDWNTVKYTPKGLLLTHEAREKEFSRLQSMGVKGVKIDFFNGDGQSMIRYYTEILKDAAAHKLLVNFHGATLPRGWARTYPNLVTTEAVKGFEMVTFQQEVADVQANHCAMLPYTRNAFDPMDFTPMNLYKINTPVKRKTTGAFELATSVLFLSGIQHFAESPDGMSHVPEYVRSFLQELPVYWDDVKYIDGFPGKLSIIARRKNNTWYIAGINGEDAEKKIMLNLAWLKQKNGNLIKDGNEPLSFEKQPVMLSGDGQTTVDLKANGGFVMVF